MEPRMRSSSVAFAEELSSVGEPALGPGPSTDETSPKEGRMVDADAPGVAAPAALPGPGVVNRSWVAVESDVLESGVPESDVPTVPTESDSGVGRTGGPPGP